MAASVVRRNGKLPISVLLVHDREDEALHNALAMRQRGWRVDICSPPKAIAQIAARRPHVVVIDEGARPAAEAFDLAARIRGDAGVPCVVLTSLGLPGIAQRARAAGCACVSKPCRASSVVLSVNSAVAVSGVAHRIPKRSPTVEA